MEQFIVHGQNRLSGSIEVRGAKNAAFPILAASILTDEDTIVENLPLIEDVYRMLEILESSGALVEWIGERTVKINTKAIDPAKIDQEKVQRFRGSVVLLGPLLARFQKVYLAQPGGCAIGARPIDTHLDAFAQLGVTVLPKDEGVELELNAPVAGQNEVILNEFSVTATANMLLFGAASDSEIVVKIADYDYQIQDLQKILLAMGAEIDTPAFHTIRIRGKKKLHGVRHHLMYDPTEAGTFILFGATVPGEITVQNVEYGFLDLFFKKLADFGVPYTLTKTSNRLADVRVSPSSALRIDKIQCFIYPGLHSDLQSPLGVLATQSKGLTLLHDPLYAGRLKYLEELNKMGAEIFLTDPHRAIINGPTPLYGTEGLNASDLRGGAALVAAALLAQGKSSLENIYQVDRGYEKIDERLRRLGADIQRITV